MKSYTIASFYKFVPLMDMEHIRAPLLAAMKQYEILGTILLAREGINGSFAGTAENVERLCDYLRQDSRFTDIEFKKTFDNMMPFEKAKVKFRKEIVTLGVSDINPLVETGTRVLPDEWNQLIQDPEVVLVDTRNTYEVELGTFKQAINPNTEYFRDFPEYVTKNLLDKKHKKIAMFCTGGIRCEKSTAYLKKLGFPDVYQLEGGILSYIQTMPAEESLWEGKCFVFDERISILNDSFSPDSH